MARRLGRLLGAGVTTTLLGLGALVGAGPASAETVFATELLDRLVVVPESTSPPYGPGLFREDVDADGDGCRTRQEVLIAESTVPAAVSGQCSVQGSWTSWYDGVTRTDPAGLAVDHLVPLAEAWASGAGAWSAAQREAYANDLDFGPTLAAVTVEVDRAKGDRDPAEWMPPAAGTACRYALEWTQVKYRWGLTVDPAEEAALIPALLTCGSSPVQVPARADVPAPGGQVLGHTLRGGQRMTGGQALRSPDGRYRLEMQTDGNLVSYAPGNRVLWSSGTWGRPGTVLEVQTDGNVVLYDRNGRPLWDTRTWHDPGAYLTVQDDGNTVVYRPDATPVWHTGWDRSVLRAGDELVRGQQVTSPNGRYHVVLQHDGNVVVYHSATGRPLYSAGSYGGWLLRMQADGNLVAYRGDGIPLWATGTWREGPSWVAMQDDGNLVVYRADGTPSWRSGWDVGQVATQPSPGTPLPRPGR
ncbi:hypothetical protein [Modestobacter sp. URMC 112]